MLYLVATPIGHLGDMTQRAVEVLKTVDVIASEDTRKTGRLLKHYGIEGRQIAFHEHNEVRVVPRLTALLREGKMVALVTDAGTPGIADPGYRLVQAAIADQIPVTMTPGPCAVVMAIVLSGLPTHSFTFRGFPPRKPGPRRRFLEADRSSPHTLVYYESPYRLEAFLSEAVQVFGDRRAVLANDLTKRFEKMDRATLSALREGVRKTPPVGEYVVVIAGADEGDTSD